MVLEMILLGVAPLHGGIVLLLCCLVNRVLSGMAEGMANGADEALVFDSMAERGRSNEWPSMSAFSRRRANFMPVCKGQC